MRNGDMGERALRKLGRLVARSLAGVTPRIYRALGILDLEKEFRQESGGDSKNAMGDQERISGCSLQETTPRVRRELSS